ncbi:MAG: CFI-box-CTERM domain-containing protein [Nitrosopumilaceae archaeon]
MPDLKKLLAIALLLLLISLSSPVWAKYDASHLRESDITMTPTSGPPGTKITITVSNFPDISGEPYPYPDFYIYLPFTATAIGTNVPSPCGTEMCFPIYTYEDAQRKNFADKTITFTLFSLTNPKPVYLSGLPHSVCDIIVNSKVQQSYSDVCDTKSQPTGEYEIKFAWATKTKPDEPYFIKTLKFTVTEGTPPPEPEGLRLDQTLMQLYKDDIISEQEFEKELRGLGYSDEEIRQAKAVLGKLPHQENAEPPVPDQTKEEPKKIEEPTPIEEPKEKNMTTPDEKIETTPTPSPKSGCLIATAAFGSEMAPQVQLLRELRDNTLLKTTSGSTFMTAFNSVYYSFSPTVAEWERQNPVFKEVVKATITPLISTLSILNYLDIDSEAEMITYGIGIILLNAGMYFVAPAVIISKLNSFTKNKLAQKVRF